MTDDGERRTDDGWCRTNDGWYRTNGGYRNVARVFRPAIVYRRYVLIPISGSQLNKNDSIYFAIIPYYPSPTPPRKRGREFFRRNPETAEVLKPLKYALSAGIYTCGEGSFSGEILKPLKS